MERSIIELPTTGYFEVSCARATDQSTLSHQKVNGKEQRRVTPQISIIIASDHLACRSCLIRVLSKP